jgi:hypothetical protein
MTILTEEYMYQALLITGTTLVLGLYALTPGSAENYPRAQLSNGVIQIDLYLPDAHNGYYRGTRFDWSGIISQVEYEGHTYFDEWKDTHDPTVHDDIVGPVEEFKTRGAALGFHEAKPGEAFVKIGVGLLEKPDAANYQFSYPYKILKPGIWKTTSGADWIEFEQQFNESGWGYLYTKRITLTKNQPEFTIAHSLKNTASKPIETHQYNHNFFMLDRTPVGTDYVLRFPFEVLVKRDVKEWVEAKGNELLFNRNLQDGSLFTELEGFSADAADHEIVIENRKTGAGVKINGDRPLSMFNFWTLKRTICPEPYIELNITPGETVEWETRYLFFQSERRSQNPQ